MNFQAFCFVLGLCKHKLRTGIFLLYAFVNACTEDYDQSFLHVMVSSQKPSIQSPWKYQPIEKKEFIGSFVGDGLVLITAYAVIDAKMIELKRIGGNKIYSAEVLFEDRESNLALLKPLDSKIFDGMKPIQIGDRVAEGTQSKLLTMSTMGQLVVHNTILTDVMIAKTVTSRLRMLSYKFKILEKGLGWSEPIIHKGRLVAMASGNEGDYVYAIPAFTINHFLKDSHNEKYLGFPSIGIVTQKLDDGALRKMLRADQYQGVRIVKVFRTSPFYNVLQPDDVVLALNKENLSSDGLIDDATWGKIGFQIVTNQMYSKDLLTIHYLRNSREYTVSERLERFDSNKFMIPYYRQHRSIPYLIYGGMVFQELSLDYLKAWGSQWQRTAPSNLVYLWEYKNEATSTDDKKFVVLNRVLANDYNRGYDQFNDVIVKQVNGIPIYTLDQLESALRSSTKVEGQSLVRISLDQDAGEVLLEGDKIIEAHKQIAKAYDLNSHVRFFEK